MTIFPLCVAFVITALVHEVRQGPWGLERPLFFVGKSLPNCRLALARETDVILTYYVLFPVCNIQSKANPAIRFVGV